MNKPFIYGTAVRNENFTDRKKETRQLMMNFENGLNTIIISPRRMGKTSLVNKVMHGITDEKLKVVYLDIYDCRSEYDEYISNNSVSASNGDSALDIVLHGTIGGDAASTFTLNGQKGSYIFVGASRQSKLVSYDSQTGKLIVDAYLNGSKIGFFDGIYVNGRYKGIFQEHPQWSQAQF